MSRMQRRPPFRILCYTTAPRRITCTHTYTLYIYMYVHILCIHTCPRAPHGLSSADLTKTYRCRAIRRERPTSRQRTYLPANFAGRSSPSSSCYLPENTTLVHAARNLAERILGCFYGRVSMFPKNFSYKYDHVARRTKAEEKNFRCDLRRI